MRILGPNCEGLASRALRADTPGPGAALVHHRHLHRDGPVRTHPGAPPLVRALVATEQITIAAVNGPAVGLGLDIALACDFIVAAPEAAFSASFIKRGLIPDGGGLYFLPRRVGLPLARELVYSGRMVDAEEALRIRLADRLAGTGQLLADTLAFASEFTGNSRSAIALMKSIISRTFETPLEEIAALGHSAQAISYTSDEHRESVERFLRR